jgi:hypothetical protein
MTGAEYPAAALRGEYHDVLRDPSGRIVWDRGWTSNAIVGDCRRLLAAFMRGTPAANGLLGLQVGAGLDAWDTTGPPPATSGQTALADPKPFTADVTKLTIDFLDGGTVTANPTNKLQIQANLGNQLPPWPNADHPTGNLREFGLVAKLGGTNILINYVTHPVIAKDPASTLERTIWLTF